jgi:hypothetical protein
MLTPDEPRSYARRIDFLAEEQHARRCDPPLFDCLCDAVARDERSVSVLEHAKLLPGARFVSGFLGSSPSERTEYFTRAARALAGLQLVFFDSEIGLQVRSVPYGAAESEKYLFWTELESFWKAGCSVLVYQQYRREDRAMFRETLTEELRRRTRAPLIAAISTARVLFLLAGQGAHEPMLRDALARVRRNWKGHLDVG